MEALHAVLHDNDLLMAIFKQLPHQQGILKRGLYGYQTSLWQYAQVALTCHTWNNVLRGKSPGLEKDAQFLLRRLMLQATSPSSSRLGLLMRPRFCAALGISVAKANAVPENRGRIPHAPSMNMAGGAYVMPAAFDYIMEVEGGWAGMLRRFQAKVRAKVGAEERKAASLERDQKEKVAVLKKALTLTALGSLDGASDELDPDIWNKLAMLTDACNKAMSARTARIEYAEKRGSARSEELAGRLGRKELPYQKAAREAEREAYNAKYMEKYGF